jgi:hypothetical protein
LSLLEKKKTCYSLPLKGFVKQKKYPEKPPAFYQNPPQFLPSTTDQSYAAYEHQNSYFPADQSYNGQQILPAAVDQSYYHHEAFPPALDQSYSNEVLPVAETDQSYAGLKIQVLPPEPVDQSYTGLKIQVLPPSPESQVPPSSLKEEGESHSGKNKG